MTRYVPGCVLVCVLWHGLAYAGPAIPPAPLPAPTGATIHVSTVSQLQNAVAAIASNTTIVIAPGTYQLTSTLYINGSFTNVGVRGATANRSRLLIAIPSGCISPTRSVGFILQKLPGWLGLDLRTRPERTPRCSIPTAEPIRTVWTISPRRRYETRLWRHAPRPHPPPSPTNPFSG